MKNRAPAIYVANGYGKLAGLSQVQELDEIPAWQGDATDRLNGQGPPVSLTFGNSLH